MQYRYRIGDPELFFRIRDHIRFQIRLVLFVQNTFLKLEKNFMKSKLPKKLNIRLTKKRVNQDLHADCYRYRNRYQAPYLQG
jgi:hypothetical protein